MSRLIFIGELMSEIEIIHLLGYLSPKHWADALKEKPSLDKEKIYELMREQEKTYTFSLIPDVEDILKE